MPWCGPSSTAIVHTEKLGVRSDAAPTSDWPGLFIGLAADPRRLNSLPNCLASSGPRCAGRGYALAAQKALPQAIEVADRWHLMENASHAFLDAGAEVHAPDARGTQISRRSTDGHQRDLKVAPPPASSDARRLPNVEPQVRLSQQAHRRCLQAHL